MGFALKVPVAQKVKYKRMINIHEYGRYFMYSNGDYGRYCWNIDLYRIWGEYYRDYIWIINDCKGWNELFLKINQFFKHRNVLIFVHIRVLEWERKI